MSVYCKLSGGKGITRRYFSRDVDDTSSPWLPPRWNEMRAVAYNRKRQKQQTVSSTRQDLCQASVGKFRPPPLSFHPILTLVTCSPHRWQGNIAAGSPLSTLMKLVRSVRRSTPCACPDPSPRDQSHCQISLRDISSGNQARSMLTNNACDRCERQLSSDSSLQF